MVKANNTSGNGRRDGGMVREDRCPQTETFLRVVLIEIAKTATGCL